MFESEDYEDPKIGDYVKIYDGGLDSYLMDFLEINIGKIIKIDDEEEYSYTVEFDDLLPPDDDTNIMNFDRDEISEILTPEEVEQYKLKRDSNKYNL